jgi:CheY-like chemotaxis protein
MFSQYQTEIIVALLIFLVIITLYIFSKKSKKSKIEELKEAPQEVKLKEIHKLFPEEQELKVKKETVTQTTPQEKIEDENFEMLSGKEEGDFNIDFSESTHTQTASKTIHKRDVPSHEKITKQHFKEFAGERILVAEDNLINQKVIAGLLAESGIELIMADDGQIALDILEEDSNFLMVLMDAHMPRVDGFEATRIIRKNPNYDHILVVALSGDTAADDIAKMRNAGMAEQLEKPLRMEALYDILYAYTGESPSDEKIDEDDEYVEVIETKELHGDKGLQICGGDESFYHEILSEFVKSYKDSDDKLLDFIKTGKLQEADTLLLDIKGVSANIGADLLTGVVSEMKDAIKEEKIEHLYELISLYKRHLERLLRDIENYQNS